MPANSEKRPVSFCPKGLDPGAVRTAEKATGTDGDTFETIARERFAKHKANRAAGHADKIIQRLERDIFPWIGGHPISEIKAPDLLAVIRRIEGRGALETAHRALANRGQIFRYAVATGRAERDLSGDLRGALAPVRGTHFAALTDPAAVGELLRAIDAFKGSLLVQSALRLAPLVFVRPGELRKTLWADIDLDKAKWRYVVSSYLRPRRITWSRSRGRPWKYSANGNRSLDNVPGSFRAAIRRSP